MAKETPAYCVGNFVITNEELLAEYSKQAMPIVQNYGGRAITSDRNVTKLEGEPESVLVILEFPSMKAAEEFYYSPEYAAVKQLRIDATAGGFLALSKGLPAA
jgi:uncharacterized protein (DUF1330 family)